MSDTRAWLDTTLSAAERAEKLVEAMTLEQKIAQLHGAMETVDIYALSRETEDMEQLAAQIRVERHVSGIDELGIPRLRITNGPVGVGMGDGTPSPPATSLPMTIGLAAGFEPDLAHAYGDIIGAEAATLGQHVLEGPGVCLHRTPLGGRNFEYFLGGSVPVRRDGRRGGQGHPGPRRDRDGQALRGQRPGAREIPGPR